MKHYIILLVSAMTLCYASAQTVKIDTSSLTEVSPYIFGHNLEHTRAAINTGLSAQMLQNRKFAGKPSKSCGVASKWFGIGEKTFFTVTGADNYTRHICLEKMSRINEIGNQMVANMTEGSTAGIGQYGLALTSGRHYTMRTVTKVNTPLTLSVQLTDRSGKKIYASHELKLDTTTTSWKIDQFELVPDCSDNDAVVRYTFTKRAEVYFGALSMMPADNFHGMRKDVIENLKAIGPAVLRWPGGNFAGEYRWKDGLLPVDERAPLQAAMEIETQPYSDGYDYHEISTDDFVALCREVGAEPFITINPVWSTPTESAQWVEYCNGGPDTEYGKIRAERGYPEPFNVKFWSLGNEMGFAHMEGPSGPAAYAEMAGKHADSMLAVSSNLKLFSSGPYPSDNWAQESASKLAGRADYVSLHTYCGPQSGHHYTTDEDVQRTYEQIVSTAKQCYDVTLRQRKCLDATGKNIHISFDEWNQWYSWYRPSCVGEGIYAAKVLHMFLQESTALDFPFCCYFQPVGEGAIVNEPERSFLTANGQVFSIMKEHKGGKLCNVTCESNDFDGRSVVATLKDNIMTVTLVNDSYDQTRSMTLSHIGKFVSALQYTSKDVLPYSRFEESQLQTETSRNKLSVTLQPHSVAILRFKLH